MEFLDIEAARKAGVSRRGGVRTRGGRLPPIRIGNVTIASNNKKTFVPNIPQRRVKVKEEFVEAVYKIPKKIETRENKSRERGRGRGKVFLQTEGSFLGEGPALKLKKEFHGPLYDRSAYCSSIPRSKTDSLMKIDSSVLDELLKSYDDNETFHDSTFKPMRLPYAKLEGNLGDTKVNIKKEKMDLAYNSEEVKMKIKQEVIEEPEIKQEVIEEPEFKISIKCEPLDDYESYDTVKNYSFKSGIDLKEFKLFQEDMSLVLLQLPTRLPFSKIKDAYNKEHSVKTSGIQSENDDTGVSIKNLSDGFLGKMQFMKSGKMRLIIGSSVFFVEEGAYARSLYELASVSVEEKSTGSIIGLGKIKSIASVSPRLLGSV